MVMPLKRIMGCHPLLFLSSLQQGYEIKGLALPYYSCHDELPPIKILKSMSLLIYEPPKL
jgi:hypothetical protein